MIDVKASVSIILPGRTMYTEQECSKNPKLYENFKHTFTTGIDKNIHKETLNINLKGCKTATYRLNISSEQFKMMMNNSPSGPKDKKWKKMTNIAKMGILIKRMCEDMNGIGYSFNIFE